MAKRLLKHVHEVAAGVHGEYTSPFGVMTTGRGHVSLPALHVTAAAQLSYREEIGAGTPRRVFPFLILPEPIPLA